MFSRKTPQQPSNVLSHWYVLIDGIHFSTLDFYERVESSLAERKVPRLRTRRVEYHEGGSLSDKRVYLRLARERFAFEVCAAPFGSGYFFSLRFVEIPRGGWLMLLLILASVGAVVSISWSLFLYAAIQAGGWFWVILGGAALLGILCSMKWQAGNREERGADDAASPRSIMADFDSFLLNFPVLGEWYERRRKETYHRHDTRLLYQNVVSEVVKRLVDEMTAAQGVKLLETYDYDPIMTEFYRPIVREPGRQSEKSAVHVDN